MRERERVSLKEIIAEGFSLPKEAVLDLPLVTITGGCDLTIENYKNVAEFSDGLIRFAAKGCFIKVEGERLTIKHIGGERAVLSGIIRNVEIIR